MGRIFVGTAGWNIPRAVAPVFDGPGSQLQRYAGRLPGVEINSSFYRSHMRSTYARWAASTPDGFRFAVKCPRTITHDRKLRAARLPLERFLDEVGGLGISLGPILVQLPPSLVFDPRVTATFFDLLRVRYQGSVVCEPRHETWFSDRVAKLFDRFNVSRVVADPPPASGADAPGGSYETVYFRLHGSPRKYWSRYSTDYVRALVPVMRAASLRGDVWCVFDNTATGAAFENALELRGEFA